jgi:hypothetical protein
LDAADNKLSAWPQDRERFWVRSAQAGPEFFEFVKKYFE